MLFKSLPVKLKWNGISFSLTRVGTNSINANLKLISKYAGGKYSWVFNSKRFNAFFLKFVE